MSETIETLRGLAGLLADDAVVGIASYLLLAHVARMTRVRALLLSTLASAAMPLLVTEGPDGIRLQPGLLLLAALPVVLLTGFRLLMERLRKADIDLP